jgi:MFS family permease
MYNMFKHLFAYEKRTLNKALRLLIIISGIYMFAFGMFMPLYALFVERMGGDIMLASNAWAVFYIVAGIMTFIIGNWESKMKETELGIAWSQLVAALAYLAFYLSDGPVTLYIAQIFLGIAAAFFWPAFHSVYGKHVNKLKSTEQWGWYDGLAFLLPALAAVAGGWLIQNYGFGMVFIIMIILSLMNAFLILILPRKIL